MRPPPRLSSSVALVSFVFFCVLLVSCLPTLSFTVVPTAMLLPSRRPSSFLCMRRGGGRPKGPLRTVVSHVPINDEVRSFLDGREPDEQQQQQQQQPGGGGDHEVRVTTASAEVVRLLEDQVRLGLVNGVTLESFDPVPSKGRKARAAPALDGGADATTFAPPPTSSSSSSSGPPSTPTPEQRFHPALPPGKDYQLGVLPLSIAQYLSSSCSLDLVLLSSSSTPPLLKIVDYSKHLYDSQKQLKSSSKAATSSTLKELKMTYSISPNDYGVRLRLASSFLMSNSRVRLVVPLKGREVSHAELGERLLERMVKDLEPVGDGEGKPRREGRAVEVSVKPKPEVVRKARKEKEEKLTNSKKETTAAVKGKGRDGKDGAGAEEQVRGNRRTTVEVDDTDPGSALS